MAPAAGSGTAVVRALLARGRRDPTLIASVLHGNPAAVAEIVACLDRTLGSRFVEAVLSAFASSATGEPAANSVEPIAQTPIAPTPRS